MIWCIVTLLGRQRQSLRTAFIAIAIAFATEFLKLIHTPALDRLRATSTGGFLLGHHFATADLAVYALAIATMAVMNHR